MREGGVLPGLAVPVVGWIMSRQPLTNEGESLTVAVKPPERDVIF
jgi:hypothetical protein